MLVKMSYSHVLGVEKINTDTVQTFFFYEIKLREKKKHSIILANP